MKVPKTPHRGGFSIRIIIALIFILFGVLVLLEVFNIKFIKDTKLIADTLKYGTALGSLVGGFFILFRKKEVPHSQIKI